MRKQQPRRSPLDAGRTRVMLQGMAQLDRVPLCDFLCRTPFFGGLDDPSMSFVATMMQERSFPAGANVVAEGKTSRIVFTVAAPDAKPKVDFSKVLGFLKKKAGGE